MKKILIKNKSGFTLVELLATIALLTIVFFIGVVSFGGLKEKILEKQYNALVNRIYESGKKYYSNTGKSIVFISDLIDFGYLDDSNGVKDPRNNNDMSNLFFNLKNDDHNLYYCKVDGGNTDCNNIYDINVDCSKSDFCIKDDLAYTSGIKIIAKVENKNALTEEILYQKEEDGKPYFASYNVILEVGGTSPVGDGAMQKSGYDDNIKYYWYSKSNPNNVISTSDSITVPSPSGEIVTSETYILYVIYTNNDVYSENGNELTAYSEFTINFDTQSPDLNVFQDSTDSHKFTIDFNDFNGSGTSYEKIQYCVVDDGYTCSSYNDIPFEYIKSSTNISVDIEFPSTGFNGKNVKFKISDDVGNENYDDGEYNINTIKCKLVYHDIDDNYLDSTSLLDGTINLNQNNMFDKYDTMAKNNFKVFNGITLKSSGTEADNTLKNKYSSEEFQTASIDFSKYCLDDNSEIVVTPVIEDYKYQLKFNINNPKAAKKSGSLNSSYQNSIQILNSDDEYVIPGNVISSAPTHGLFNVSYNFIGWYVVNSEVSDKEVYGENSIITIDDFNEVQVKDGVKTLQLNANWSDSIISYMLTMDANGGNFGRKIVTKQYGYGSFGESISLSSFTPTRENYKLAGWCTKSSCSGWFNKTYGVNDSYVLYANKTLYAKWVPKTYSITYDANGGTFNNGSDCKSGTKCSKTGLTGSTKIITQVPVKDGSTFKYWRVSKDSLFSSKYESGATYSAEESITLYAIYSTSLTLSYSAPGALNNIPESQYTSFGGTLRISDKVPVYSDKTFLNWKSLLLTYNPGESITLMYSTTLTAQTAKNDITITYNPNGGYWSDGSTGSKKQYSQGTSNTQLITDIPTKSGYNFKGWSITIGTSSACKNCSLLYDSPGSTRQIVNDATFNAYYKEIEQPEEPVVDPIPSPVESTCKIHYMVGSTKKYTSSVTCGTKATVRSDESLSGYTFAYWDESTSCNSAVHYKKSGSGYSSEIKADKDITLNACFTKNPETPVETTYKITFKGVDNDSKNTGYLSAKTGIKSGQSVTLKEVYSNHYNTCKSNQCKKSNMKHISWTCNGGIGTISVNSSFNMPAQDITCTANYLDICEFDQSDGHENDLEYSYDKISNYNDPSAWGAQKSSKDICYSKGKKVENINVANYRLCSGEYCKTFGISGKTTLEEVNNTYGCDYNKYWCK